MTKIEYETPTLNSQGEIVAWTRHAAEQFTQVFGNDQRLDLIILPPGLHQMGSPRHTGNLDEQPQHLVTIKSFLMSKFLITQSQWRALMGKLPPCRFKGDDLPVERVSWQEAQKFCQGLSKTTGRHYYLASETSGNMPVVPAHPRLSALAKPSPVTSQITMASIRSEKNHGEFIFTRRPGAGNFRPMRLGCMTCTAIYGNGAPIIG